MWCQQEGEERRKEQLRERKEQSERRERRRVGQEAESQETGAGRQEEGWRGAGPCTCVDIHGKGVLLVRHQAVSVILGYNADDVVFQLRVEVTVDGGDVGNDSAWLG